jgi:hypothetical protein
MYRLSRPQIYKEHGMDPYLQVRIVEQYQAELRAEAEERRRGAQFKYQGRLSSWLSTFFARVGSAAAVILRRGRVRAVGPTTRAPRMTGQESAVSPGRHIANALAPEMSSVCGSRNVDSQPIAEAEANFVAARGSDRGTMPTKSFG